MSPERRPSVCRLRVCVTQHTIQSGVFLSFFVHCAAAAAAAGKGTHYVYIQAYKCHRAYTVIYLWIKISIILLLNVLVIKSDTWVLQWNRSLCLVITFISQWVKHRGVLHRRTMTVVGDGLWSGDIRLRRLHFVSLGTVRVCANTSHCLKYEWKQSCLCFLWSDCF